MPGMPPRHTIPCMVRVLGCGLVAIIAFLTAGYSVNVNGPIFNIPGPDIPIKNETKVEEVGGQRMHFVVLGDSIAMGFGVPSDMNYASLVAHAKGWTVKNLARNGAQTAGRPDIDLLNLLTEDTPRALETQAAVREADIINISIGGNDLLFAPNFLSVLTQLGLSGMRQTSQLDAIVNRMQTNFEDCINRIRELNPDATITVLRNIVPDFSGAGTIIPGFNLIGGGFQNIAAFAIDRFNASFDMHLLQNPEAFVLINAREAFRVDDIKRYFIGTTHGSFDPIHLNSLGHAKLARVFIDEINDHFSTKNSST